jgi:acyl dehydratase
MIEYQPRKILPDDAPGPWSDPLSIAYDQRDVLLYAVGIGCADLRQVWEGDAGFAVFPTFPIRWGGRAIKLDEAALPPSPGPLTIDAERHLMQLAPLPLAGTVQVRSRLLSVQPRGKGSAFLEFESEVIDSSGQLCTRMVSGSFRRGVKTLGDIAPFDGAGTSRSVKVALPAQAPDLKLSVRIPDTQAHVYRLSGDYNPLHIDPKAARFGGFDKPILHGLCTYGYCAQLLLGVLADGDAARFGALKLRFSSPVIPGDALAIQAWHDGPGRVVFEARVDERVVVNNAFFEYR